MPDEDFQSRNFLKYNSYKATNPTISMDRGDSMVLAEIPIPSGDVMNCVRGNKERKIEDIIITSKNFENWDPT
jgi:hypothetical protein